MAGSELIFHNDEFIVSKNNWQGKMICLSKSQATAFLTVIL
jgi:hypothetical protein